MDTKFKDNTTDGQLKAWSVNIQTLSTKKIQVKGDAYFDKSLTVNGMTTLKGGLTVTGSVTATIGGTISFTNAQGTAPFTVVSTTKVDKLNADLIDGLDSTELGRSANFKTAVRTKALGWYGNMGPSELDTTFRATITKKNASSTLRIHLKENVGHQGGNNGHNSWASVQVRMDGNPISNPFNCIGNDYDYFAAHHYMSGWQTHKEMTLTCLATGVPAGDHVFSVWYQCNGNNGSDCYFGNYGYWMGGTAANATLIVEEVY